MSSKLKIFFLFWVLGLTFLAVRSLRHSTPAVTEVSKVPSVRSEEQPIAKDSPAAPAKSVNDSSEIQFQKITRLKRNGTKARLYSILEKDGWVEDQGLGSAIRDPDSFRLKELVPLFRCKLETTDGKGFQYFSASSVCDGYGPKGVPSGLYLASNLVDESFQPLYLCHTKNVLLYNTLKSACEHPDDRMNGVLGYVKI